MGERLAGKVALITGSTAGCGRAIAIRFAAEGAKVMVTGRNREAGAAVLEEIRAAGGQARFHPADLGVESEVEALVAETVAAFGRLDILVNNASPTKLQRGQDWRDGPMVEIETDEMEAIWRPALYGFFWVCRRGIAAMLEGGGGSVVNISSTTSLKGVAGTAAYTAAKGAINALTRSMAVEYGRQGVRVNAIVLGLILTSDTARKWTEDPVTGPILRERQLLPWGRPQDIANAALFLASDESAFITGALLVADGGASINASFPSAAAQPRGGA